MGGKSHAKQNSQKRQPRNSRSSSKSRDLNLELARSLERLQKVFSPKKEKQKGRPSEQSNVLSLLIELLRESQLTWDMSQGAMFRCLMEQAKRVPELQGISHNTATKYVKIFRGWKKYVPYLDLLELDKEAGELIQGIQDMTMKRIRVLLKCSDLLRDNDHMLEAISVNIAFLKPATQVRYLRRAIRTLAQNDDLNRLLLDKIKNDQDLVSAVLSAKPSRAKQLEQLLVHC